MDLGIAGRRAIICGASRGLGRACAEALASEGVNLVLTGRTQVTLQDTAAWIRWNFDVTVDAVTGDMTSQAGMDAVLAVCPAPDILINNVAGPPLGDWRTFEREQWLRAADNNMVASILLIRAVIEGMAARKFGRVINITSAVVKRPDRALILSVTARLGLTGFVNAIAKDYIKSNVTINNLLPEQFLTERLQTYVAKWSADTGIPLEDAIKVQSQSCPAGRFGRPEEFGAVCAFYCSIHASFFTGHNVMLDGGRFAGVL